MDINELAVEKEFGPQASLTKRRLMGVVVVAFAVTVPALIEKWVSRDRNPG